MFSQMRITYPNKIRSSSELTQEFKMSYDFELGTYIKQKAITIKLLSGESFTVLSFAKSKKIKVEVTDPFLNGTVLNKGDTNYTFTAGTGPYKDKVVLVEKLNDEEYVELTVNVEVSERITGGLAKNASAVTSTSFEMNDSIRELSFIEGDGRFTYLGDNHFRVDNVSGCIAEMEYGEFHRNEVYSNNSINGFWKQTLRTCDFYSYGIGSSGTQYQTLNGNWIVLSIGSNPGLFGGVDPIVLESSHVLPGDDIIFTWSGGTCFDEFVVRGIGGNEVLRINSALGNSSEETITTLVDEEGVYEIQGISTAGAEVCIGWVDVFNEPVLSDPPVCGEMKITSSCDGEQQRMSFEVPATDDEDGMRVVASASGDIDFDFGMKELEDGSFGLPDGLPLLDGVGQDFDYKIRVVDKDGQSCSQTLEFEEEKPSVNGFAEVLYDCNGPMHVGWSDMGFDKGTGCKTKFTVDGVELDVSEPDGLVAVAWNNQMYPPESRYKDVVDAQGDVIGGIEMFAILEERPYIYLQSSSSQYTEADDVILSGDMYSANHIEIIAINNTFFEYKPIGYFYDQYEWWDNGSQIITKLSPGEYQLEYEATDCYYSQSYNEQLFTFFTVENVDPVVTINAPLENHTVIENEVFEIDFTAFDPGALASLKVYYGDQEIDLSSQVMDQMEYSGIVSFDAVYGKNDISITALDNYGGEIEESISINVEVKQDGSSQPEITIVSTPQDVEYGEYFAIEIEVTDDDDDDLKEVVFTYGNEAVSLPNVGSNYFVYEFLATPGHEVVGIEAIDDEQIKNVEFYTIGLINDVPKVEVLSPSVDNEFEIGNEVTVELEVSDYNGIQTIRATYGDWSGNFELLGDGLYTATVTIVAPEESINITVVGNEGEVVEVSQLLKVKQEDTQAPKISVLSPYREVGYGDYFTVEISVEDENDDIKEVTFVYGSQFVTIPYVEENPVLYEFQAELGQEFVEISALDEEGNIDTDIFAISLINDVSEVTIISPILNDEFEVGAIVPIEIEASDLNGIAQVSIVYNGETIVLTSQGGVLYTGEIELIEGDNYFTIIVEDQEGEIVELGQDITVKEEGNDEPVITVLSPQNDDELEKGDEVIIEFEVYDPEDEINSVVVTNGGREILLNHNGGSYTGTLEVLDDDIVTITVKDAGGNKVVEEVMVIINNDLPEVSLATELPETIQSGSELLLDFTLSEMVDNVELVYNGQSLGTLDGDLSFNQTIEIEGQGIQEVELIITDVFGDVVRESYVLEVMNDDPVIEINSPAFNDQYFVEEEFNLDIEAFDPEEKLESLTVTFEGQSYDLLDQDEEFSISSSVPGLKEIEIVAVDELGNISKKSVFVIIVEEETIPLVIEVVSENQSVDKDFSIEIKDAEEAGVEQLEILFFNVENEDSEFYKHVIDEAPYELNVGDLEYFPWEEGTIGMQVYAITDDGRVGVSTSEFEMTDLLSDLSTQKEGVVKIYPNPTKGIVYLNINEESKIEVINAIGQVVYQTTVTGSDKIDLNNLPTGVYFIKLQNEEVYKLMKE